MTKKELEIVRADMAKKEYIYDRKAKIFSWVILMTLLLA